MYYRQKHSRNETFSGEHCIAINHICECHWTDIGVRGLISQRSSKLNSRIVDELFTTFSRGFFLTVKTLYNLFSLPEIQKSWQSLKVH